MIIRNNKTIFVVGLIVAVLALLFVASKVPIKTFFYYTSTGCSSNLLGGGNVNYHKYRVIAGESSDYDNTKSELESLDIPQSGFCEGGGFAPTDYTTIELFLF